MDSGAPPAPDDPTLGGRATDQIQHVLLGEAVDVGPALVFVADDDGRYVAVNQRACDALGYTRVEMLARRVTDVAVAPEAPELYEAMLRDRTSSGVTPIRRKDGRLLRLRYNASEVTVAKMTFWVSIGVIDDDAGSA
ncbi:MAG TPA: PAS domain-containing protein [Gaiellaceae bacterium]|nr:PAS domain-containing protein [Gaiellaceae bacterium]